MIGEDYCKCCIPISAPDKSHAYHSMVNATAALLNKMMPPTEPKMTKFLATKFVNEVKRSIDQNVRTEETISKSIRRPELKELERSLLTTIK